MNTMLIIMFAAIGLGLFGKRFEGREMRAVAIIAATLAVAYFVRPTLMT